MKKIAKILNTFLLFIFMTVFFTVMIFGFTGKMGFSIPVVIFIEFFIGLIGWQIFKKLKKENKSNIIITPISLESIMDKKTDYHEDEEDDPLEIGSLTYWVQNSFEHDDS